MTNLVGPKGIQAIATGFLFKEAPPIFPEAEAHREGPVIRLTNLVGLDTLNFVAEPDSRFIHANALTRMGTLTAVFIAPYCFYASITSIFLTVAYKSFQWYCTRPSDKTIYLQPEPTHEFPSIAIDENLDKIVQNAAIDSKMVNELDQAFREYRLKVFGQELLEEKIKSIVERSIKSKPVKKPLLDEVDDLYNLYKPFSTRNWADIIAVIGPTGAGKSTLINYLSGQKMQAINSLFFRKEKEDEDDLQKIIIAENSVAEIGHRSGVGSSETLCPQFYRAEEIENHSLFFQNSPIFYCDCPGFRDNRKRAIEICNAKLIHNIISDGQVRAILFLIEFSDFLSDRGNTFLKNLKLLQLLIKDCDGYYGERLADNHLFFVIVKAPLGIQLSEIGQKIRHLLQTVGNKDSKFYAFCRYILKSKILDKNLSLCDPCDGGRSRSAIIKKIKVSYRFWSSCCGYPLSPGALRELEVIRKNAQINIEKTLLELKKQAFAILSKKIAQFSTAAEAKSFYHEFPLFNNRSCWWWDSILKGCEVEFPNLADSLKADEKDWKRANFLLDDNQCLEEVLGNYIEEIKKVFWELRKEVEKYYYKMAKDSVSIWEIPGMKRDSSFCNIF